MSVVKIIAFPRSESGIFDLILKKIERFYRGLPLLGLLIGKKGF